MGKAGVHARDFGWGVLSGLGLVFLCYWWIGALSVSVTIGLITGGFVVLVGRWRAQLESKGGTRG